MPSRIITDAPASDISSEPLISLVLSPTLEQDYCKLGVFPGLRAEAAKRSGTALFYRVTLDFARKVLAHAQARMKEIGTGRGLYQAYRALAAKLAQSLDDAEGVDPDPGPEQWEQEQAREFARLRPGDVVTNEDGDCGRIECGLGVYKVLDDEGQYRGNNVGRFSYRLGYLVVWRDEAVGQFNSPGDIYSASGETTHLRLVRSN